MRWRSREGPWGSHQLLASALKCATSVGSTDEFGGVGEVLEDCEADDAVEERRKGTASRFVGILGTRGLLRGLTGD